MTTTRDIINALVQGDLTGAKRATSSVLDEKIHDTLELRKVEVT